jgi:predicted RNA binding protein YcfA (HicA-like mRNA interferase family)
MDRQRVLHGLQFEGTCEWLYPPLGGHHWTPTSRSGVADQSATYSREMKVRDVIRLLLDDGWYRVATRGSHHQYKHLQKPGRVTVPGSGNDDLAPGTLASIFKQAGLRLPAKE